jgi:uncharacterized protein YjbI with pentapeptide repeats
VSSQATTGPNPGRDPRADLRADCGRCFGLCCVVPAFSASADFAIDKPAGQACPNLRPDSRCGVHSRLRQQGFTGCTVYDCFGAGQQVSQVTFGGRDWRQAADTRRQMFAVFPILRELHELRWYLTEALTRPPAHPLADDLRAALEETERRAGLDPGSLPALDAVGHWQRVNTLLLRTAELVRAEASAAATTGPAKGRKRLRRGADLIGVDLRGLDLRATDLRGAYLIGADLRGTDLTGTDLIGADLRAANLRGTRLVGALFVTQMQLNAAIGDAATGLPATLDRPQHWSS